MGTCNTSNTVEQLPTISTRAAEPPVQPAGASNPFYDLDQRQVNEHTILSKYRFQSRYTDEFLGECSVIQDKQTQDLYLCKELKFGSEEEMAGQVAELEARQRALTSPHVVQIKEIVTKSTEGFFSEQKKVLVILDYPFISFHKEISSRISKQVAFSKEEVVNFISSTVKGYGAIQGAGFKTDKVRLKNIFISIRNRQPIIKVAENSLIESKSNYEYMINDGHSKNKDIYLSPQEYAAWVSGNKEHISEGDKAGVYSLGMSVLDVCLLEPSREVYHFTQRQIDQVEINNRIEIAGKKYGSNIEKALKQMLNPDPTKRISFAELQNLLPQLQKSAGDTSRMSLSIIPTQKSNFINNDNTSFRSSNMFKSVVSNVGANMNSRVFTSRIKIDQSRMKEEQVMTVTENYTNGNKYIGGKRANLKHGRGKYIFKDGSYYDGQWFEDKINGQGVLYTSDNKVEYEGEWRNDLYNGWGILNNLNPVSKWDSYQGEFRNGVKEGRGRLKFRNGTVYDGEFRGDKIAGRGRKVTSSHEVIEKYWQTVSPQNFQ